jgi:hypothetical protein
MYGYTAPTRISDVFDTLKKDFESLAGDVNRYKTQRDQYEQKGGSPLMRLHFCLILTPCYQFKLSNLKLLQSRALSMISRENTPAWHKGTRETGDEHGSLPPRPPFLLIFVCRYKDEIMRLQGMQPVSGEPATPAKFFPSDLLHRWKKNRQDTTSHQRTSHFQLSF